MEQDDYWDSEHSTTPSEMLDRILENYTADLKPELRFKLKWKLQDLAVSACYCKPWELQHRWLFTAKPTSEQLVGSKYINKLQVSPVAKTASLFSKKIPISVFRLQFVLSYNWEKHAPLLDYRLTTKWGDGPVVKRKEQYQVSPACQLRMKWNASAHLPDVQGHVGGGRGEDAQPLDVDYGHVHLEVKQLDMVLEV